MANLAFVRTLPSGDPDTRPITFVGKKKNLIKIPFDQNIGIHLGDKVSEDVWSAALETLKENDPSSCNLYLNKASIGGVPNEGSRHNSPSRAYNVAKIVEKEAKEGENVAILVVCEEKELLATGCAVSRVFPLYTKKSVDKPTLFTVTIAFLLTSGKKVQLPTEEQLDGLRELEKGIRLAQSIVDKPPNEMHTDAFVECVKKVGAELGLTPIIIRDTELKDQGFGGIYGVGQAAVHPPVMAILSSTKGGSESICLVGKGIIYDTGGLSIKSSTHMPSMKRDLGGAAGILGAFQALVKLECKANIHAICCMAENAVGSKSTKPDDIHVFYSGKSVEIHNTDAEGRLVMADGVAYAREILKATTVIDMATLTGAQGISLGRHHAGLLTNSADCEKAVQEAGLTSGDLTFPWPYTPELHYSEFRSAVADMRNHVRDGNNASGVCAGLFVKSHLGFDFKGNWIHLDMAYPNYYADTERATGYGVALFCTLFGKYIKNSLLKDAAPRKHDY